MDLSYCISTTKRNKCVFYLTIRFCNIAIMFWQYDKLVNFAKYFFCKLYSVCFTGSLETLSRRLSLGFPNNSMIRLSWFMSVFNRHTSVYSLHSSKYFLIFYDFKNNGNFWKISLESLEFLKDFFLINFRNFILNLRSVPGKRTRPVKHSAKIQPTLQMSTGEKKKQLFWKLIFLGNLFFGNFTRLIVMHPIKHDFRGTIPSCGNISSHFCLGWTRQTKIQYS